MVKQETPPDVMNTGQIIEAGGQEYVVRGIAWEEFKLLLASMRGAIQKVLGSDVDLGELSVELILEQLPLIVDTGGDLVERFVELAAEQNPPVGLEPGWTKSLSFGTFLTLSEAAVVQNKDGLGVFSRLLKSALDGLISAGKDRRTSQERHTTQSSSPEPDSVSAKSEG